ncbi:MAG TPA: TolC family protein [Candidatus Marinimicrobia bacterium]|nr:TolC family protein [Candidatus Neomarinimicrobiota bacterium]HRS52066.1 TolC family protein [Candidatus Neomarinimicrobiota bacterium]HRU93072.1 TolC family protein [Candidatus Neomarinimicrobiota bacterium]
MKLKLKIGVIFLITCASLFAEELNLDIKTAREIALQHNPSLKLAREAVLKSRASVNEVRSKMLPSVSAFSQFKHAWEIGGMPMPEDFKNLIKLFNPGAEPPDVMSFERENTFAAGLNLSQPVFTGGLILNSYKMSKIGVRITESQLKATEQKILSDVTNAYYGVLFANSASEVAEEALHSAEQNLAQVQKFFDVGKASRFDVLRAEVQVANFKPMVVSANNAKKLAESSLRLTLGIDEDININYLEKLSYIESDLINTTLDELITIALNGRSEIAMLNDRKKLAEKQVALTKAQYSPSLIFGTAYQYQAFRDDFNFTSDDLVKSFNSSISLSIPIFSGFATKAKVQQAKIAVKEADYQSESAIDGIKLEVKSAYFKMKETNENVQTQKKTIEQAKEALRLAELMYSEGASTQLDVLNANVALNQAKMNYQKSLYEYNVALANLKKAINQL